ncbi:DUF1826 domain-containing protein [Vibrio atypicus]|uniref:DUF1826 domain-containing protein n=1 Tax=Vibrio atypicus TaxID=558271 RepID=UPI001357AE89|nr:DUF1826 domain-containing protein [Vibrio atypicus]
MSTVLAEHAPINHTTNPRSKPCFSLGQAPNTLTDIYQEHINIAVWQRNLSSEFSSAISQFIAVNPEFKKSLTLTPESAYAELEKATNGNAPKALLEDLTTLVDMFCCLFDLEEAGLRIATLNGAMCPRFHVDHVPCRLVTTYYGTATQWLPNQGLDRSKLGHGSNGQPDSLSGLYEDESCIQSLSSGDIALLKGERWSGNENLGLVHRSPVNQANEVRLLITLDFG